VVRDPEANRCIRFPNELRRQFLTAPTPEQVAARLAGLKRVMPGSRPEDHFFLLEGQPEDVRAEWEWAMGLRAARP
jgi:hypothetical protein